jgi:hypothetical protein
MSVLPFPLTVLAKRFLAGAPKCSGGAFQVALELACHSKEDSGLGLKDLATLNKSLMIDESRSQTVHQGKQSLDGLDQLLG